MGREAGRSGGERLPPVRSAAVPGPDPAGAERGEGRCDAPGLLPLPGRGQSTEAARLKRLEHLRLRTGARLRHLDETRLEAARLCCNVENLIGAVEVPVGVAGPLLLRGVAAQGPCFLPLATTEGALVSSATRGALALSRSGGVQARVQGRQMTRTPLFAFGDLGAASDFCAWLPTQLEELRGHTREVSRHARLQAVEPMLLGVNVVARFVFTTGDAAGQNMTTACTWHLCRWIEQVLRGNPLAPDSSFVDCNASLDKKVGFAAWLGGRGLRVIASATLRDEVCRRVLKVSTDQLLWAYQRSMEAALQVGMVGHNVNVANIIAGSFIATGQDVACVHESSVAQLTLQACPGGLRASLSLPSLVLGTVGGGTHLPRQQELLELAGCAGAGSVDRLAEVIAGFCLALDLSTLAAVTGGQFAAAHERLGRNRPVAPFGEGELGAAFFQPGLRRALGDDELVVESALPLEGVGLDGGLLSELVRSRARGLTGQLARRLDFRSARLGRGSREVLVRIKPLDEDLLLLTHRLASLCGSRLGELQRRFARKTGFAGTHLRELGVYQQEDPRFVRHAPALYQALRDDARELFLLVLELLREVDLKDSADEVGGWTPQHLQAAVRGIAEVHAIWYGREQDLQQQPWLGTPVTAADLTAMGELWDEILAWAGEEFPGWYPLPDRRLHEGVLRALPGWAAELERMPRTLIHGDFNPRNLAFRRDPDGPRLCAWDWELASLQVPQRDLAELLAFVLPLDVDSRTVDGLVELHRRELGRSSGRAIDAQQWRRGYQLSLYDLLSNRLGLYQLTHAFRACPFLERVLRTTRRLIRIEDGGGEARRPAAPSLALLRAGGAR